ncbi:MAG TPA: PEPxxWA-CTERM sorting domain-containing protein [Phenylobacterium sp.]|nr:PEPxxWA-CTERM sorting domain-containing protein [Phenylobacterium sp.]
MSFVRNLLCATAFALTTAAATHASAAVEVYVQDVTEFGAGKVTVTGPGIFKNPDSTALKLVYNFGIGPGVPTFEAWAFCIDLFKAVAVPSQYHIDALTNDGHGNLLSQVQIDQIFGLAAYGSNLIKIGAPDLANKLAGIQGAIWAIEYPAFSVTGDTPSIDSYLQSYVGLAPSLHGNAYVLLSDNGRSQGFVIGVPEPATWAMMIMGFGAVGMVMRSRRRVALAA